MSLEQCLACGVEGIEGFVVTVEVDHRPGQSDAGRRTIVGLPDGAVRESLERIGRALYYSGSSIAGGDYIVVNLAPADRRKTGPAFDLAIALGMAAAAHPGLSLPADTMFCAELALNGQLRPLTGILSCALAARQAGCRAIVVSPENANEAAAVGGIAVYAPPNLQACLQWLKDPQALPAHQHQAATEQAYDGPDLADIRGQSLAKRALTIAAAGGHNMLMIGPPGSGKTMLAKRLPGLLPPLTESEALEATQVHSVAGLVQAGDGLMQQRPFRSPHHTVSNAGLIGGGSPPRPGDVSLASHGVLFLDELPEFNRPILESLRQPLEDGQVTISRATGRLRFPSACMVVAAMNPCPCGYAGHPTRACTDTKAAIHRYRSRISGPLIDRIDIHLEVPAQTPQALDGPAEGPTSQDVRAEVCAARERMLARQGCSNALLTGPRLRQVLRPNPEARQLLHQAIDDLGLSARAMDRIGKVALTIADLAGQDQPDIGMISEAIGYRLLDRQVW